VLRARCVVLACLAGCGVRAPAAIDVEALLRTRGAVEARRDLEIRATDDPRDVAARLALAALDEQLGRPSEAIAALEAVVALGGPVGVRWHPADRARLARLVAARGRARLARGAPTAVADLERARGLGAAIREDELAAARVAAALSELRHSDGETRERGRRTLAALMTGEEARGARPGASPEARGRFGVWLWARGARRAAWDELSAWHDQMRPPRVPALQDAYLVAARWWTPLDRLGPRADDLVGAGGCVFGGCAPREVVGSEVLERAYLAATRPSPVHDPIDVAALVAITLRQALRGEAAWGPALAARVDLAAFAEPAQLATLPAAAQPIIARLVGRTIAVASAGETPSDHLVIAAARVLAGATSDDLAALVGDAPDAVALRRVAGSERAVPADAPQVAPRGLATRLVDARADAAARHAAQTLGDAATPTSVATLRAIVVGYARDPVIADRLARDAVAEAPDAAAMHATIGALFDALGDPARARTAWQAAVDASAEPAYLRGLAEAQARGGDADAALISATAAAAAWGDPAVVWTAVARTLADAGKHVHALDAARSAIDLAGPDTLPAALDAAIAASQALGRDDQAARLAAQRAQLFAVPAAPRDGDPTDGRAALAAHRAQPGDAATRRLWLASRWNPRDVELRVALRAALPADDARCATVIQELVELGADRDPEVRRSAVAALAP